MVTDNSPGRPVKTAGTTFDIVEAVQARDGATISELAEGLGLAKSTVHNHVTTLREKQYLVNRDGEYHIGLKFLDHGMYAKRRIPVAEIAAPKLEQLAEQTDEVAWLVVEEHGRAVNLESAVGDDAVENLARVGMRTPLHIHAAGKAILAHLPEERVRKIVDRYGLPARTEHTITEPAELYAALETIRERGFAFMESEAIPELRSVAAPLISDSTVIGAITVAGPARRLTGDRFREDIPEAVLGAANAIELKLTYS